MKKIIIRLFYVAMVLTLTGCADSISSSSAESSSSSSSSSAASDDSSSGSSSASSSSGSGTTKTGGTSSSGGTTTTTTTTSASTATEVTYTASESPFIIEVDSSTSELAISGLPTGTALYMLRTNPTASTISSSYTRSLSSASGVNTSSGTVSASSTTSTTTPTTTNPWSHGGKSHCLTLALNEAIPEISVSSARAVASASTVTQITPVVDSTTKSIYVDTDSDISTFAKKTATLRAIGEYCYVWVVGDTSDTTYWTTGSASGEKINATIAQSLADNFDKLYPMVRTVFGDESDELIYGNALSDMSSYSDTGTMVNIVVYDIGADYAEDSSSGTVGYFYAKDYYKGYTSSTALKASNAGKYFYIDAYYTANYTSMVYSTLAHEFQHMVDWGVKTMATITSSSTLSSSTWFNEMLSMLCEDMMKDYLEQNNADFTDDDSPFQRLPMFNRRYYATGLEYKTSGTYDVYYSYANNYAFGAWLVRNYGGVDLLNALSTNAYVDTAAITAATGKSMEALLKAYGIACLVDEGGTGFNVNLTQSEYAYDGYTYPFDAIDLWELSSTLPDLYEKYCENEDSYSAYYSFDGPVLFGYNAQQEIRPYGFTLIDVGTATSETVTLGFNTSGSSSSQKVYIIIY